MAQRLRRAGFVLLAAWVAGLVAASAAPAATFTFSRTDYVLATWAGNPVSATGNPLDTNDRPLAIADFNGDGKPDIAVSDNVRKVVYVLLNNGSGGFAPVSGSPASVCNGPDSILAGDFNGDGKQDLLVDCFFPDGYVYMYPGDGGGGFGASTANFSGYGPMVRAPVLNHDDDVVYNVTGGANAGLCYIPVVTFKQTGTRDVDRLCPQLPGATEEWGTSVHWYDSTCGGDEILGFAYNPGPNDFTARILALGNGGTPCTAWEYGDRDSGIACCPNSPNPTSMGTADLDKDGSSDIVMSSSSGFHTLSGWNQTTGVGTTPFGISSSGAVMSFGVADFNGDGNPDLAGVETFAAQDHNVVELFPGQGSVSQFAAGEQVPVFGNQQNYSDAPELAVADLNGDGKPDIVTRATGGNAGVDSTSWTNEVTVLLNASQAGSSGSGSGHAAAGPWHFGESTGPD